MIRTESATELFIRKNLDINERIFGLIWWCQPVQVIKLLVASSGPVVPCQLQEVVVKYLLCLG